MSVLYVPVSLLSGKDSPIHCLDKLVINYFLKCFASFFSGECTFSIAYTFLHGWLVYVSIFLSEITKHIYIYSITISASGSNLKGDHDLH